MRVGMWDSLANVDGQEVHARAQDLIAASIYDAYAIGPYIRPMFTRYWSPTTNMMQVCSIFLLRSNIYHTYSSG